MNGGCFLLDSNVLITAYRSYYAFDIAPNFWVKIEEAAANGEWCFIDRVAKEITSREDELARWLKDKYQGSILDSGDARITSTYSDLIDHYKSESFYRESALAEFASCADSWLIAHGIANNSIIVSLEKLQKTDKRVKIPNICEDNGVACINTFEFLRQLKIKV